MSQMKRVSLQPAYVLHTRSFRETSLLVEVFSHDYGRLALIARSVRKTRSALAGLLQPFVPLLLSWSGKNELMTLTQAEVSGSAFHLQGECLFAGLYLNELLMYLLQKWDAHRDLFSAYDRTLASLQANKLEEKTLRAFEKCLLEELGYGIFPKSEMDLLKTFSPHQFYRFFGDQGFVLYEPDASADLTHETLKTTNIFSGKSLIAMAQENWQDATCLLDAKRLTRFLLAPLLGDKQIYSRRFFA